MRSKIELGIGGAEDLDLLSAKACCHAAPVNRKLLQAGMRGGAEFSQIELAFGAVRRCIACFGLTRSIPLQNHCIDWERGGWSWCEFC